MGGDILTPLRHGGSLFRVYSTPVACFEIVYSADARRVSAGGIAETCFKRVCSRVGPPAQTKKAVGNAPTAWQSQLFF